MLVLNKNILTIGGNRLEGGPLTPPTPPTPEPLPPIPSNTVRVRTNDGNVPYKYEGVTKYTSATLVEGTTDVYDVSIGGTNFNQLLCYSDNVTEVLGANITGVTNISNIFNNCTSLTTVQLFDTSNVTDMSQMFSYCTALTSVPLFDTSKATNLRTMLAGCTALTSVPLFDTSKATNMNFMFSGCTNVQSGALALYQQASTQATPPSNHNNTFYNCGINTQTGAAELAQIPSSWGGTGA